MQLTRSHLFEFGPFQLDSQERLLFRNSEAVALPPKTLELLVVLVENCGHLLEKEELMKRLWPDSFVEEANLSHHVFALRKALGDGENGDAYIETIPRRGYRFVAKVKESDNDGNSQADSEARSRSLTPGSNRPQLAGQVVDDSRASEEGFNRSSRSAAAMKVAGTFLGLAVLVASILFVRSGSNSTARIDLERVRSIAVLPFSTIGLQKTDEYIGLAMADALITRLGSLDRLIVRPTSAILKYQNGQLDVVAAAREMRVDAALAGSIQRSGDRMRLTVQLIRASDARTLWTEKFDEKAIDLFALEDSVSESVARSLLVELTAEQEKQLTRRSTDDLQAYKLYVKAQYFADRLDTAKAREHYEQAIQRDANYAPAYLGMAGTYFQAELPGKERRAKIAEWVSGALRIDDTLAEAHLALATIKIFFDWDWPGAEAEIQRTLRLKPNYARTHLIYARYWQALGRLDKATTEIKQAQDLDPVSFKFLQSGAQISYCARGYHQAIKQCQMALDIHPDSVETQELLALSYELGGMYEEAMATWRTALAVTGETRLLEAANEAFSRHGYKQARLLMLREKLRQLKEKSRRQYVHPINLAFVYSALGDKEQALKFLEMGFQEQEWALFEIKTRPEFKPLHAEPRFLALLQKMGLTAEVVRR